MKEKIYLWKDIPPYNNPESHQEFPFIVEYFLNNGKNNPCVLVIPGGAYEYVSYGNEGEDICKYLNSKGISAAYLNYRIAPDYHHPVMETDAKRAVKLLKYYSDQWNIDGDKISVIGFSAGGHLACMTALRFDYGNAKGDEIDKISSKPFTAAVGYGVNTLNPKYTHLESLKNLLGDTPDESLIRALSSENIIRDDTPPFFLWHTAEDKCVNPECSLILADALIKNNIPCELHIFPYGPHGTGTSQNIPLADVWLPLYIRWLNYYCKNQ